MQPLGPQVSVLMAVFNTAAYLHEALASIRDQSFSDFELIVIDDGSTDGSRELLESFAASEPRMKLVVRENRGLVETRNELLQAASGRLVAWMDSDDVSLPNRLELQIRHLDACPQVVCLGGAAQCIDPEGNLLNLERYPLNHCEILIAQQKGGAMRFPTTMMRRQVALDAGGFRQPFRIGEDLDLLTRMSEVGKMANLDVTLYLYRQHLTSVVASLSIAWMAHLKVILELARERRETGFDRLQKGHSIEIPMPSPLRTEVMECEIYKNWSSRALENGNRRLAWKYAKAALRAQPTAPGAWKLMARTVLKVLM